MPLKLVLSNKKKDHLVYEGERYIFRKTGAQENIWYCVRNRREKCTGKAYTANNEVVRTSRHNHTPDPAKLEAKIVQS